VKRHVEVVGGTLRDMEEQIDRLSRRIAAETLQAGVEQIPTERPLFRKPAASGGTGDTPRAR
jgi:hypothetical protein